jgi:hypothetical protein
MQPCYNAHPELFPSAQLTAGLNKEMTKSFEEMGVLELVTDFSQIDSDALVVPSMLLAEQKHLASGDKDCISLRFAMIGSSTDASIFGDTSAATVDEASMLCCLAAL